MSAFADMTGGQEITLAVQEPCTDSHSENISPCPFSCSLLSNAVSGARL